jgi:hypothetical protein
MTTGKVDGSGSIRENPRVEKGRVFMKSTMTMAFLLLLLGLAVAAPAEDQSYEGYVTDDMCGKEHMMEGMTAKECTDECVGMGAAYALFVPADEKMYQVDDPEKLKPFAGEDVVVTGSLGDDGETLRVTAVRAAKKD